MPEPITAVYILTNSTNRVFYTGVTSNLEKRIAEAPSRVVSRQLHGKVQDLETRVR
jgi:predicted GIY-YIG superfamily endonuclease